MNDELSRGLALREAGTGDERTYRVHKKLGEPCHVCGTPIAQVDFEEHTIFYCPNCQTGGRTPQGSAAFAPASVAIRFEPWTPSPI